ncbi:hypothetical protein EDB87DRAFT_298362 [Lactarius vividus]|nr:hypothetical protein EDB87DRAFT_298362 [Lactarius vividus]
MHRYSFHPSLDDQKPGGSDGGSNRHGYWALAPGTVFGRVCIASPRIALVTQAHECAHPNTLAPSACFNEMSNSSVLPPDVVALLPLAIKEQPVIDAERYISAVGFSVLVYDLLLTFGEEVRYIWRRPVTSIKVLYLVLRYGVAIGQVVYFQAISGLTTSHITHSGTITFCGTRSS